MNPFIQIGSIVGYMRSQNQVPIMTNSESLLQFGNNAYAKPAAALNMLRETVLGRELFDFAFKEYAERWKFKRPTPADFFRTMVLASRVPAILASSIDLAHAVATADAATPASAWLTPLTLLVCYAVWCKADLMLFRASMPAAQPA